MPGSMNEAGGTVIGANGTDQRALVLLDALGARLVEAIKAGVNATSDGLGVLADETERLDDRITALAEQLERHANVAPPAAPEVDLTPVHEAIAELRDAITARDDRDSWEDRDEREARDADRRSIAEIAAGLADVRLAVDELRHFVGASYVNEGPAETNARLDALEASFRAALEEVAQTVAAHVANQDLSPSVDLTPILSQLSQLSERGEQPAGPDPSVAAALESIQAEIASLRDAVAEQAAATQAAAAQAAAAQAAATEASAAAETGTGTGAPDLAPVQDLLRQETAELRETVLRELADLRAAVRTAGDNAPVVDAVSGRLAELRGSLQARIADLHSSVAAGSEASPAAGELTAAVTALTERLDRIEAALGSGPDLAPFTDQVSEAREELAERVEQLHVAMAINTEMAAVRHDAVAGRLASMEEELHQRTDRHELAEINEAVRSMRAGLDSLADRLLDVRGATVADVNAVQEAVLAAVDGLSADVAGVRERAAANVETNARAAREVHDAIAAIDERVAARVAGLSEAVAQGPDLTPILDSVAALEQQINDVRGAVDHVNPGAAMLELLRAVGELRGAVLDGQSSISGELAAARSNVERWLAQVDSTVASTSGATAEDLGLLLDVAEELRQSGATTAERAGAAEERLAAIEAALGRTGESLDRVDDRTNAIAERAGQLAAWTEAQTVEAWLSDLRAAVDEKLTTLVQSVPTIEERMAAVEQSARRGSDTTNATLEGLRAHLASGGGFTGQLERFRDLRSAIDALAASVADRPDEVGPAVVAAIESATAKAVDRLESSAAAALARVEQRDGEIVRRTDELASSMGRTVSGIESELREVIAGLSASERFVRSRFTEIEVAIGELRREVAHVRTLRASLDSLTTSLDAARHQARLAAAIPTAPAIPSDPE